MARRIDIEPGEIRIGLSPVALARQLEVDPERLAEDLLEFSSPFRHRKRGVETRLILSDRPPDVDATLLRNVALAHRYFDLIRSGRTFGEIAASEGVSKRRIQQLVELAFLAPDVIRAIRDGTQPTGLTSDWLIRHTIPPLWTDQRAIFATL